MAACGGGGGGISSNPAPTPTPGPYSLASLNGSYAFQMSGQDGGGPFARVGSFTANGAGSITGGAEDVNSNALPGSAVFAFTSGSYTMQTNGKGNLILTNATGIPGIQHRDDVRGGGFITQTDGTATASGNFTVQDTTTFSTIATSINGPYVFDFSGLSPQGFGESLIGQFTANGARWNRIGHRGHQQRRGGVRSSADHRSDVYGGYRLTGRPRGGERRR